MELREKIISLTNHNTVAELSKMLDQAHVAISWWGQRLVSIDGYTGSVEINELASKYLKAAPFQESTHLSLQERLDCDTLWGRINKLYIDSNKQLNTYLLYKHLVALKEFRPYCRVCAGDPLAIIQEWDLGGRREALFEFTPDTFKEFWDESEKQGESCPLSRDGNSIRWLASREMVESVLKT